MILAIGSEFYLKSNFSRTRRNAKQKTRPFGPVSFVAAKIAETLPETLPVPLKSLKSPHIGFPMAMVILITCLSPDWWGCDLQTAPTGVLVSKTTR